MYQSYFFTKNVLESDRISSLQILQDIIIHYKSQLIDCWMLLKWQATILNRIYETTLFDKIIIPVGSIESINYSLPLEIYHSILHQKAMKAPIREDEFLDAAHLLCKSKLMEEKREKIILFNQIIRQINNLPEKPEKPFGFFHVIIFSSLSKCTIWPGMYKTSQKLVPSLIEFYSNFHKQFMQFLQYKFDPLILSTKFNRIVKNIKQKKLANPQLFAAVEKNNLQKIFLLTEEDPSTLNQCVKDGLYLTHFAASHANLETLRYLLTLHANFQLLDLEQQTPIFYAVKRFDLNIVKFFVEQAKVNINHTEYQSRTPIYLAAFQGNLEIVEYLYSMGANPQIQSKLARTPLSKACYLGNYKVAEYLIKLGVRIESVDSKGRTALHNAAWGIEGGRQGKRRGHIKLYDSPECVELLVKAGHKIDFEDFDKFTPLFSAISSHADRSLRLLVNYGANLQHKTIKNQTGVFIAAKYGHLAILKILIEEYHCDFLQENQEGYSPLAASLTREQSPDCTFFLLNLYLDQQIKPFLLQKLLQCIIEYKRIENCQYIVRWIREETNSERKQKKSIFIASNIAEHLTDLLSFVFSKQSGQIKKYFFRIVKEVQDYLSNISIESIFKEIQAHKYYVNETIKIIMNQGRKGHKICHLALNHKIHQKVVLQLLSIDTNLTQNIESLHHTFIQLIQLRFTKAILHILQKAKEDQARAYKHSDIMKLLFSKINGKISISDFCLVHGYFDIHKIINSFYQQQLEKTEKIEFYHERPAIPKYQYKKASIDQVKSFLMPILNIKQKLKFDYLTKNHVSQEQLLSYRSIIDNISLLKVNPIIVKTLQDLQYLSGTLSRKKMIGIDIQHYFSSEESFICLVQIATFDEVFIIDRFNLIHQQVRKVLIGLFKSQQTIKIFHSYDNDLKWLVEDYQIQEFHNIMDTSRIYSLLEAQKNQTPSLKFLAQKYLGMQMKKQYQKSDWRIRPLFPEMLEYAGFDAKVLPYILMRMLEVNIDKGYQSSNIKVYGQKRVVKSIYFRNQVELL